MPVRRKVFRIEQMGPVGTPAAFGRGTLSAKHQQEIVTELKALRDLTERRSGPANVIADVSADAKDDASDDAVLRQLQDDAGKIQHALIRTKHEIAALHAGAFCSLGGSRLGRELNAIAVSAERATHHILDAAESIDDAARSLSASVQREQEQALALDVQDHVLRIFEACNFQDLHGQRIGKVLTGLKFIEERIAQMMDIWGDLHSFRESARAIERRERRAALHGPRLDDSRGHFSQDEIDIMFATG